MKCPVCKADIQDVKYCHECGFDQLCPEFLNRSDAEIWFKTVVLPFREEYWLRLKSEFYIKDSQIIRFDIDKWSRKNPNVIEIKPTIPYGVTEIGAGVFSIIQGNKDITGVTIPPTVEIIGKSAFSMSNLRKLTLPNSVKVIGDSAFAHCLMETLELNEGLEIIGKEAFHSTCLRELNIPSSVTQIGDGALHSINKITLNERNPHFVVQEGCLYDHYGRLISSVDISARHLIIQPGTKIVASHAFSENRYAEKLFFANGVEEIREFTACRCSSLKQVIIPKSVKTVGKSIFAGSKLANIFCERDHKPIGWDDGWNAYCNATVHWGGTWHYDSFGEPVLNSHSQGEQG